MKIRFDEIYLVPVATLRASLAVASLVRVPGSEEQGVALVRGGEIEPMVWMAVNRALVDQRGHRRGQPEIPLYPTPEQVLQVAVSGAAAGLWGFVVVGFPSETSPGGRAA